MVDFLFKLMLGSAMTVLNMLILLLAAVLLMSFVSRRLDRGTDVATTGSDRDFFATIKALSVVMTFLFAGHLAQFASWAVLFLFIGEFSDFGTAFYHSAVNFTSLGYGDIVMSEEWRLLGALEAANGVLMFGLSAGMFLSVITRMFEDEHGNGPLQSHGRSRSR